MGKNKVSGAEASLYALLIICLLMFCNGASAVAQEANVSRNESQVDDASREKAEEAAASRKAEEADPPNRKILQNRKCTR